SQRLLNHHWRFGHLDLRITGRLSLLSDSKHENILPSVIDRDVLCRLEKRSLRTRSVETRLAVKFATQPDSNSIRAFAISTLPERMGKPTARISRTGEFTKESTTSRS